MGIDLNLGLAFVAGLLSFLSPFIQVLPANIRNSFIVVLLTGLV